MKKQKSVQDAQAPKLSRKKKVRIALISALAAFVIFVSGCAFSLFGVFSRMVQDAFCVGLDYIQLDHPLEKIDWKELRAQASEASSSKQHPYVLVTAEDFDRARAEYYSDEGDVYVKDRMDYAISQADIFIDTPYLEYKLNEDGEMLEVSRQALNRIMTLAGAWQITGSEAYALRCWQEMENVCNFKDWHDEHFLDTTEMSMAVSLGYDWLYDYLTQEQRDFIAEKVYDYGIKKGNPNKIFSNWWSWSKVNWNTQCYGGIGVACMVFSDYYPDKTAKFLSAAYYNMPIHFETFSPDGSYIEGNSYWEAMSSYMLYFITTSRNFFGSDFGLSTLEGFNKIGFFPVYISAPQGVFNFGDNRNEALFSPSLHWFAREYSEPLLTYFQTMSVKENEYARESMMSCLWYDSAYNCPAEELDEPLALYMSSDYSEEFVAMRSAYCDAYATYIGMKSGYNYTNHGDLDIGSFIFDALGERWFMDLGKASYSLPGYFNGLVGGGRWRTYMKRAEGHNTLVINPDMADEDQYPFASVKFSSFTPSEGGGSASMDMSDAYIRNKVKSVTRSIEMFDSFKKARIVDSIFCKRSSEVWWFAHTAADIEISEDGKTATLSITDAETSVTKRLIVRIESAQGTFEVMKTLPLSDKSRFKGNVEIEGVHKLAIHLVDITDAELSVVFEPVYGE